MAAFIKTENNSNVQSKNNNFLFREPLEIMSIPNRNNSECIINVDALLFSFQFFSFSHSRNYEHLSNSVMHSFTLILMYIDEHVNSDRSTNQEFLFSLVGTMLCAFVFGFFVFNYELRQNLFTRQRERTLYNWHFQGS